MKRLILLTILFLITIKGYSQRWDTNEIDEFTGKLVRITKYENVTGNLFYRRFCVAQNDKFYYLQVQHKGGSNTPICKNGESQIVFKFKSGETYTLSPTDEIDCNRNMTIYYPLTMDDMAVLQENEVEKFRIYYTQGYKDQNCSKPDYFKRTLALFF